MYNQIIYFVVALSIFALQQPGRQAAFSPLSTLLMAGVLFCLYTLLCRILFQRVIHLALSDRDHPMALSRFHTLQSFLPLPALLILALDVYVLNIKYHLIKIPLIGESLTATGLAALGLYGLHLTSLWIQSHTAHRILHHSRLTLWAYVRTQWIFSLGLLAPWLFISLAIDLMLAAGMGDLFDSPWGQAILVGALMLLFMLLGPWLVVRLWRCAPIDHERSRREMQEFCDTHRFSVGNIYQWPVMGGESLTAGVVGILPKLRYILITKALLILLNTEELRAVVAHEMGHVRRFHLPFFLLLFLFYMLFAYSANDVLMVWLLQSKTVFTWAMADDSWGQTLFSLAYGLPFLVLLLIYFRFVFGYFLRNSERQADIYAMELQGHPYALVTSLRKIASAGGGNTEDQPSWHHYSIRERIDFLLEAYRDKSLIRRHDLKLYTWACFFFLAATSATLALHHLQDTEPFKKWQRAVHTHLLQKTLEHERENAVLYGAYAGLLMEQERYGEAEEMLKKALSLDSKQPVNLNNLAWLYATAPEPFFNPEKALQLAQEAIRLAHEPYILDTLAEAYYANHQFEKALETIQMALDEEPANRDYYLQQRDKFEKAMSPGHAR